MTESDAHDEIVRGYAACEGIMSRAARNFAYGIKLLPPDRRGALAAVYAFARRIDDIGDGDLPAERKLALLQDARLDIKDPSSHRGDPVLVALGDAASRLPIPLEAFGELIDGVELDVHGNAIENWEQLNHYCRCVAGSIGRLSIGVFGLRPGADPALAAQRADALGVALQLTNILRDIREDLINGRVYLPANELAAAGITLTLDANRGVADPDGALVAEVRRQAARAREWYAEGLQLLPMLERRGAACSAAMSGIYRRLLERIEREPSAVLTRRLSLPAWEKVLVAARSLAAPNHPQGLR